MKLCHLRYLQALQVVERSACLIKSLKYLSKWKHYVVILICISRMKLICAYENLENNVNLNIRSKLQFVEEKLQLAFMNIEDRRYSTDLLSICFLRGNTSSSLYKQTRDERLLTIPSTRYIKKLTSALSVETGLTENTYQIPWSNSLTLSKTPSNTINITTNTVQTYDNFYVKWNGFFWIIFRKQSYLHIERCTILT